MHDSSAQIIRTVRQAVNHKLSIKRLIRLTSLCLHLDLNVNFQMQTLIQTPRSSEITVSSRSHQSCSKVNRWVSVMLPHIQPQSIAFHRYHLSPQEVRRVMWIKKMLLQALLAQKIQKSLGNGSKTCMCLVPSVNYTTRNLWCESLFSLGHPRKVSALTHLYRLIRHLMRERALPSKISKSRPSRQGWRQKIAKQSVLASKTTKLSSMSLQRRSSASAIP